MPLALFAVATTTVAVVELAAAAVVVATVFVAVVATTVAVVVWLVATVGAVVVVEPAATLVAEFAAVEFVTVSVFQLFPFAVKVPLFLVRQWKSRTLFPVVVVVAAH